jgi:hypothetical protein
MDSKLFHHSNGLCASEKSNWQETEFPTIFFPEDPVKQLMLLAGLLAHPSSGLPIAAVAGQWRVLPKKHTGLQQRGLLRICTGFPY